MANRMLTVPVSLILLCYAAASMIVQPVFHDTPELNSIYTVGADSGLSAVRITDVN
jgi:hypothetical protein